MPATPDPRPRAGRWPSRGRSQRRAVGRAGRDEQPRIDGARWERLLERIDWQHTGEALGLAPRELDVVRLTLNGHTQRAVAAALDLSLGTVKTYMRRAYRKLRVVNRSELALAVLTVGLPQREP